MSRKARPIITATGGTPSGRLPGRLTRAIDRGLAIQRPAVLAHLRGIRKRHPDADPARVEAILANRYVTAVTTGGAAVGATAVVPGIGTATTLALSGVETAGFLEATALYAQSMSELRGVSVEEPERARALVLTLMLGREGSDLVRGLAGEFLGGPSRSAYWGELVTSTLPSAVVGRLATRLKSTFIRRFAVRGGASLVGRAIPFGVGAVIGGVGNRHVAKRVVRASHHAFGPPPVAFAAAIEHETRR